MSRTTFGPSDIRSRCSKCHKPAFGVRRLRCCRYFISSADVTQFLHIVSYFPRRLTWRHLEGTHICIYLFPSRCLLANYFLSSDKWRGVDITLSSGLTELAVATATCLPPTPTLPVLLPDHLLRWLIETGNDVYCCLAVLTNRGVN
jgi:hypothetical protein